MVDEFDLTGFIQPVFFVSVKGTQRFPYAGDVVPGKARCLSDCDHITAPGNFFDFIPVDGKISGYIPTKISFQNESFQSKFDSLVLNFTQVLKNRTKSHRRCQWNRGQKIFGILFIVVKGKIEPTVQNAQIKTQIDFPGGLPFQLTVGNTRRCIADIQGFSCIDIIDRYQSIQGLVWGYGRISQYTIAQTQFKVIDNTYIVFHKTLFRDPPGQSARGENAPFIVFS